MPCVALVLRLTSGLGPGIEDAELISRLPKSCDRPHQATSYMVLALVIIGMTMDPYGAAIIVNATIKNIGYDSGIEPVHFWLTVLTAFELGYLTPPVALNHLLTRQVAGVIEEEPPPEGASLWRCHEKILLPLVVVATALVIVAFGPLLF